MSTIYIDQAVGVDSPGNGAIDRPYQTLAYAIFTTPSPEVDRTVFQIRKSADAEYDGPTQSATKKAKKDAQGLEKKRLKAEAEEKEARERQERREKRLEESRKVVLVEDPSLPTPSKVSKSACVVIVSHVLIALRVIVQDREPRAFAGSKSACVRMGTPSSRSTRNHVYCLEGWHGLPASRANWSNCACGSVRKTRRLTVSRTKPTTQSHCSSRHPSSLSERSKSFRRVRRPLVGMNLSWITGKCSALHLVQMKPLPTDSTR